MLQDRISLLAAYQLSPETYVRQQLGVTWWSKQVEVARALLKHKRVFVKASHSVGKTHLAGGLVNWAFDCFFPSLTFTTAPTEDQVKDTLWKEVRVQRGARPGLMPKAPRMELSPDHFAVGYTARDASAFQGRHEERVFIIFDEAVGIEGQFWDGAEGMLTGEECFWLAIMNPTDTASRAFEEEQTGAWHSITISALEHPNIVAELEGRPAPFPAAVRLSFVQERIRRWCTPISPSDRKASDFEFPPGSGLWYRPGPLFESRVLGRWPSSGTTSVWSEAVWLMCLILQPVPQEPLQIGCDVAREGDDYTSIIARRGSCALHHETHNGWKTNQTAGQLKKLCKELAEPGEDPARVLVMIDDDGVGGGVTDQAGDFNFVGISAASTPLEPENYPNRRSELWFAVAQRADEGRIDLSRLSEQSRKLLRRQAMAPRWWVDSNGRRVVERKEITKRRIKRSPDDMDALNLAFAPIGPRPASKVPAANPLALITGTNYAGGRSAASAGAQGAPWLRR